MRMDMAVGVMMTAESVDGDPARKLIHAVARRAGVTPRQSAEALLEVYRSPGER